MRHSGAGRTHCRAPGGSEHDTPPATYGTEGCAARGRPPPPGAAWGAGSPPPASAPAAGVLPCPGPRLWCWWRVFTLLVSGDSGLRACEACAESHGHSPTSRGQGPPRAQPPRAPQAAGGRTRPPSGPRFSLLRGSRSCASRAAGSVQGPKGHSFLLSEANRRGPSACFVCFCCKAETSC